MCQDALKDVPVLGGGVIKVIVERRTSSTAGRGGRVSPEGGGGRARRCSAAGREAFQSVRVLFSSPSAVAALWRRAPRTHNASLPITLHKTQSSEDRIRKANRQAWPTRCQKRHRKGLANVSLVNQRVQAGQKAPRPARVCVHEPAKPAHTAADFNNRQPHAALRQSLRASALSAVSGRPVRLAAGTARADHLHDGQPVRGNRHTVGDDLEPDRQSMQATWLRQSRHYRTLLRCTISVPCRSSRVSLLFVVCHGRRPRRGQSVEGISPPSMDAISAGQLRAWRAELLGALGA